MGWMRARCARERTRCGMDEGHDVGLMRTRVWDG